MKSRDRPHVTEVAESHVLIESDGGDALVLWDTPGFRRQRAPAAPPAQRRQSVRLVSRASVGPVHRSPVLVQPAGHAQRARVERRRAVRRECRGRSRRRRLRGCGAGDPRLDRQADPRPAEPARHGAERGGRSRRPRAMAVARRESHGGLRRAAVRCVRALLGAGRHAPGTRAALSSRSESTCTHAPARGMASTQSGSLRTVHAGDREPDRHGRDRRRVPGRAKRAGQSARVALGGRDGCPAIGCRTEPRAAVARVTSRRTGA